MRPVPTWNPHRQALRSARSSCRRYLAGTALPFTQSGVHLFSHVTVGTNDMSAACAFYDAILSPIGLVRRQVTPDGGPPSACWVSPGNALPRFYVYAPFDRASASVGNGSMVAFLAPTVASVDASYTAGLGAGGRDEGPPGERIHYGAGYYGAYLRDPDGNKVHIVHRGDLATSAA